MTVVAEIEVVNDLADRLERGIAQLEPSQQHLEGAQAVVVGELRPRHVETDLAPTRAGTGRHESKPRPAVDEAPDQPSARDPIDHDPGPRHPGGAARRLGALAIGWAGIADAREQVFEPRQGAG